MRARIVALAGAALGSFLTASFFYRDPSTETMISRSSIGQISTPEVARQKAEMISRTEVARPTAVDPNSWMALRQTACDGPPLGVATRIEGAASIGRFAGAPVQLLRTLTKREDIARLANDLHLNGRAVELGVCAWAGTATTNTLGVTNARVRDRLTRTRSTLVLTGRGEFAEANLKVWHGAQYVLVDMWTDTDCVNNNASMCVYAGNESRSFDKMVSMAASQRRMGPAASSVLRSAQCKSRVSPNERAHTHDPDRSGQANMHIPSAAERPSGARHSLATVPCMRMRMRAFGYRAPQVTGLRMQRLGSRGKGALLLQNSTLNASRLFPNEHFDWLYLDATHT